MSNKISRKEVLSNLIWRFLERTGAQLVKLIVEIVLARLLLPDDYGTIALVTVFITILNVFIDSGLGNALIQKKNADQVDFSTVFYFNIGWCLVLYLLLFSFSDYIGMFYNRPDLGPVIKVLGITIIISGVKNVQQAYVSKTMQFKKFFFSTIIGTIGAAILGIGTALMGWGVWALVIQQLFNSLVDCIILWFTVGWRPIKTFSIKRLKELYSYGWKLLLSTLLNTAYNEIYQLVIGKYYSAADLAYYNKGNQFPSLLLSNINNSIDSVLLPTLSRNQEDISIIKRQTSRVIQISVYIMSPLMIGMATVANNFIKLILTEKWLCCVPFLQIFCITFMLYPVHTANLNALKAIGRSDLVLKLEIIKKIIGVIILIIVIKHGPYAMALSVLINSCIGLVINAIPNYYLLNYNIIEQIRDIFFVLLKAVVMGIIVYCVGLININCIILLSLQILVGMIVYIALSEVFQDSSYVYIKEIIMKEKK